MAKGIKLRSWSLDIRDYETDDQFRAAVELELARFEHIGERFGIALVAAPVKKVFEGGSYVTVGWTFQTATVPAARAVEPEPDAAEDDALHPEPISDEVLEDLDEAVEAVAATDDPYAES